MKKFLYSELGHLVNTVKFGLIVLVLETMSFKSELLHLNVVESANSIEVRSLGELLEEFLVVIDLKNILNAVEVFANIVLVLKDTKGSLDLVFVHIDC